MRKILFPSVLYSTELEISDEYNSKLKEFILENTPESPVPFKVDSTFWSRNLVDEPILSEFKSKIEREASQYAGRSVYVDTMWVSITRYGCFHSLHSHIPAPVCGVYYVNIPRHPEGLFLTFHSDKQCLGGAVWDEPLENKKLLLFEGWVMHGYAPNPSNELKITIAFNFQYCSEPLQSERRPDSPGRPPRPRPVLELE